MQDGYNDYDQHHDDDDTICYLLENIKFKLNYMRIYWERNENWGHPSITIISLERKKKLFPRNRIDAKCWKYLKHLRQIISRDVGIKVVISKDFEGQIKNKIVFQV